MRLGPFIVLLLAVGMSTTLGCRQADSVSGSVTYNDQPVENGTIVFRSADGSGPGFGATIADGTYKAQKVQLGQHVAQVRGLTKAKPMLSKEDAIKAQREQGKRYGLPVDYIPEDAEGNGRSIDIQSGAQTIDFAVKGPPRAG